MLGYLAAPVGIIDQNAGFLLAVGPLPGGLIIAALAGAGALIVLLWIPVLGDRLTAFLSRTGPKVAPRMVLAGLGLLVTGLVTGVRLLDVVGACLIGAVLLALILDNY